MPSGGIENYIFDSHQYKLIGGWSHRTSMVSKGGFYGVPKVLCWHVAMILFMSWNYQYSKQFNCKNGEPDHGMFHFLNGF